MKRKNLTMKKLSAVLISATMMLNGGVPIQAASAELTDPYANETLSDGSGDEAENLEIGTDEETVNESTDEEENIEIEAEDEFDSADDGEEEALDIESETEDAMMESGDSGESAFYSEQRIEYNNKFENEEEYWFSAGQGSSFSFETEKVVYKEDGNIDYSATKDVSYEIISVENSNPDAVSVSYSEGGSMVAYQCKEIGDADLTVTYKLPDDETETTYTWLCHMHVADVQYTVKLAKTNAFQNPIYSGGRDNTMVTGTKAVITAGIDSYNEYKMKNSTVVDKNTLYEGSDYTFEWSISDDPNVTLTSNANQCELQVGNQSQEGRFKLSLKIKDKDEKYLPVNSGSGAGYTAVYSEWFTYSAQASSYELLYTTDYEENYKLYPEAGNTNAFYTTPDKDIKITINGIKEIIHTAGTTNEIIHNDFTGVDMIELTGSMNASNESNNTYTFSSNYFEGKTTFNYTVTLNVGENDTRRLEFPNVFAFYGSKSMYASNQVNGGKLKIQVDCKVHGDKYETELNEFDEIDGDEETLPVHKGDVITLTLTGGTSSAETTVPVYIVSKLSESGSESYESGNFQKNEENGTYEAVIDAEQFVRGVAVYSNENECKYENIENLNSLNRYDFILSTDSDNNTDDIVAVESNKTDPSQQVVHGTKLKAVVKNGETIEVTFTCADDCKPSGFSLSGVGKTGQEIQEYKIKDGKLELTEYKHSDQPFLTLKTYSVHQATLSLTAGKEIYAVFGQDIRLDNSTANKKELGKRIKLKSDSSNAVTQDEFRSYDFNNIVFSDTEQSVLAEGSDCDLILRWDTYDADGDSRKEWNLANLTEKDYNEIFACADEAQDSFQIMIKAKSTSDYYGYSGYLNFVIKSKKNIKNFVQSESYQKLNEGVVYLDGNPSDLNITLTDFDGNVLTQENALDIFWATNNLHEMWGEETKEMPTKSGRYRLRISPKEGSGYQGELYKYGIYLAYHISDIKATEKNGLVDVSFESKNSENVLTDVYFIIGKDGKDLAVGSVKNISTRELKDFNLAEVCARNELAVDEDYDVRVTVTQYLDSSRSQSVGDYIGIKFHYQGDKPHEHTYKTTVVKATASKDGSITRTCTGCDVKETTVIPYVKTIALSKTSYAYNGKVQKPSVTVKDAKNGSLKLNTDYTVTYSGGQKNAGTYKVVVKGKGNYDFTKTLTYKITKATATVKISTSSKTVKYRKVKKKKQTFNLSASASSKGKLTYKKTSGNNKITVSKTGKVTVKKGLKKGTYKVKIKVSAAAVTNYNAASATKTIKVVVK